MSPSDMDFNFNFKLIKQQLNKYKPNKKQDKNITDITSPRVI